MTDCFSGADALQEIEIRDIVGVKIPFFQEDFKRVVEFVQFADGKFFSRLFIEMP